MGNGNCELDIVLLLSQWLYTRRPSTRRPSVCIEICEFVHGRPCTCYRFLYAHGQPSTKHAHKANEKRYYLLTINVATNNYGSNDTGNRVSVFMQYGQVPQSIGYRVSCLQYRSRYCYLARQWLSVYLIKHLQWIAARRFPTETRPMYDVCMRARGLQRWPLTS